ncbi:MAG: nucleotidyltransferase domain-containing protein [Deferribacteres bacterium]|nr:nucleotidyltransferase domain-containing protein [candidate division KSB1 bacterium]MCB9500612.1 nucleotidyltransferase domain-containing protein [Deferribacteres bacterium]
MHKHHQESIDKFLELYKDDPANLALLLGGSIAHGFAQPDSDIDVTLVVDESEYLKRKNDKKLAFSLWDICTYPGGYIDCKVVSLNFLQRVKERGSDPARYAYADNAILLSRIANIETLLAEITRFPREKKAIRRKRFAAQLLAWKWYYSEGVKKGNKYLLYLAVQKLILFSCRLVLNENEMLYPFHKWMLQVTSNAKIKPERFDNMLFDVLKHHDADLINRFCDQVFNFLAIDEKSLDWPNHFLHDSELNWIDHEPPIDDL